MRNSSISVSLQSTPQATSTPQSSFAPTDSQIAIGFPIALAVSILVLRSVIRSYKRYSKKIQRELSLISCTTPCRGCHYFDSNPYLRCTVNPTTVLTEEAVDCSDYRPAQKTKPLFRHKRS